MEKFTRQWPEHAGKQMGYIYIYKSCEKSKNTLYQTLNNTLQKPWFSRD